MNVSQKIEKQLQEIQEGSIFKYQGLAIEPDEYSAASKKIERLISKGILERVSKGMFYKPKQTVFGRLRPREDELLKQYLFKNGQRIAYITGIGLYNAMGLTTQIPATIEIASKKRRSAISIGNIAIRPTKSYADITIDNYELLGILDAIKDFNNIPDMDKKLVVKTLANIIQELDFKKSQELIMCALKYPPKVRALLGAIIETTDKELELNMLIKSLNPFTKYNYGIRKDILPNATKWNIK